MSLSATLNNALSGLTVAQHALSLTAHNIVNANTEGYARKIAVPETQVVANRGAGVRTGEVNRAVDHFLTLELRRQTNALGEAEVLERFHDRLQDFLGQPGENNDIAFKIGQLETAFEALAVDPETGALRAEILNAADGLSAQISAFAGAIQRLRADADGEIETLVADANGELEQIASLNREIVRLNHLDQGNPELLDRRDALVKSLSAKLDLSTYVRDDGAMIVQSGDGALLVDETARLLVYEAADQVGAGTRFGSLEIYHPSQIDPATGQPDPGAGGIELISSGVRASLSAELQNDAVPDGDQLITTRLRSGQIMGLLEVRDRMLPELDDQLQELAAGLRFAINAAHNDTSPSPPPSSLTGTRTDLSAFAGAVRSGTATFAVVDRTAGTTVSAFQIDVGAAADETDLVSAINAGLGALGTASIGADGALRIALADPAQGLALAEGDSSITIQDPAGRDRTYGLAHYFGLNDVLVQERSRASSLAVRPDLMRNPGLIGTAKLDVTTGPLTATLGGRGDNRGALEVASALRSAHDVIARGNLPAATTSMGDYAASMIARVSVAARRVADDATSARSFAEALEFRAAAVSGVNVDEEMSRLVQLQKSYTVAARLISATDEMFDELFRAAQ